MELEMGLQSGKRFLGSFDFGIPAERTSNLADCNLMLILMELKTVLHERRSSMVQTLYYTVIEFVRVEFLFVVFNL